MSRVLVDTNVLLRIAKLDDPASGTARSALTSLVDAGDEVVIVPQCCYEFHVVATRPVERNGMGMDSEESTRHIDTFLGLYALLRDERQIFEHWRLLVEQYDVRGKSAHDARLVAAMLRHGVTRLLTFNVADFARYTDRIEVLDPRVVASGT